ncbi:N-acetylmuramoyl-L-alanine amidase [Alkalicella caledoniensis]|uniref:N-acetylmuramoyl-L-alanine amidase n=2 Tax=Alkalicella caledoniensis TaxID=2731377 RepID=A0A7G9WD91_ALKCA|nr:N-acetylmuramoyl-L-alanine amidase [Alkalicella caledoniensis]
MIEVQLEDEYQSTIEKSGGEVLVIIKKKDAAGPTPPDEQKLLLDGLTIVIDPGHGGTSVGAVGPRGTREKDVVLSTSLIIEKMLVQLGANVLLTRRTDKNVSLAERVNIANKNNADVFVSVHYNGFSDPSANGTETYWHTRGSNQSSRLASTVQNYLIKKLQRRNRGVKQANFYVLRETKMPAILIEPLFLTNPTEETLIRNEANQKLVAEAVVEGLVEIYS